jgi:hypothetical protein
MRAIETRLALVSFVVLYLEVVLIRWLAAYVPYASFFSNHILLGALSGVALGFFLAARPRRWVDAAPALLCATVLATALFHVSHQRGLFGVTVGDPARPDRLFFGTIWQPPRAPRLGLPVEATLLVVFVTSALLFAGLGQELGKLFDDAPRRLRAYVVHLVGGVAGALAATSSLGGAPLLWFLPALLFLAAWTRGRWARWVPLAATAAVVGLLDVPPEGWTRIWSPYGRIDFRAADGLIFVGGIGHQQLVDPGQAGVAYGLPYRLLAEAGAPAPRDVLVIGAGSGNDVAIALAQGARHVDAVEIDPVILALGRDHHPARPHDDPRARWHTGDGRAFLDGSERSYDLIVYGLVDSLTLHSSYASVRLENYLFTREAFAAARARLKPGGVRAVYNYFRAGWLVARVDGLCRATFGVPPVVLSLPPRATIEADDAPHRALTVFLAGATEGVQERLAAGPVLVRTDAGGELAITPSRIAGAGDVRLPSDDWPFPYLREPRVPAQNLRTLLWLGLAAAALGLALRVPVARADGHFFFLGAAFALVEVGSVARMAAWCGATWQVHAAVVAGALVASLLGTAAAALRPGMSARLLYVGVFAALLPAGLLETSHLLGLPRAARGLAGGALLFAPVLFSSAIFAGALRAHPAPHRALGSSAAGLVLGAALESLSAVLGLRGLVAVVAALYALSALARRR